MAITVPRDPEAWAKLGKTIREHREEAGYSRRALAEKAGVSEKSIQVAEEGRVPRGRMPQSLSRIEEALGWIPGAYIAILTGQTWGRLSPPKEVDIRFETEEEAERRAAKAVAREAPTGLMGGREVELTQSGRAAQDTFVRQMKRYRKLQNVSVEELAKRVSEQGGTLDQAAISRLEDGTRLLRMSEAQELAGALETTVDWILGSGFRSGGPEELTAPPNEEELQAEAKAVERRIFEAGVRVNGANQALAHAQERAAHAAQEAEYARMVLEQAMTDKTELEREYHYLRGRVDTLRAARGEQIEELVTRDED